MPARGYGGGATAPVPRRRAGQWENRLKMAMKWWWKRPETTVGAVVGAIVTLAIAGSIDRLLPSDPRGGWGQAIRAALGPRWGEVIAAQIALGAVVCVVLVVAGAVIGALGARLFSWFFQPRPPDAG